MFRLRGAKLVPGPGFPDSLLGPPGDHESLWIRQEIEDEENRMRGRIESLVREKFPRVVVKREKPVPESIEKDATCHFDRLVLSIPLDGSVALHTLSLGPVSERNSPTYPSKLSIRFMGIMDEKDKDEEIIERNGEYLTWPIVELLDKDLVPMTYEEEDNALSQPHLLPYDEGGVLSRLSFLRLWGGSVDAAYEGGRLVMWIENCVKYEMTNEKLPEESYYYINLKYHLFVIKACDTTTHF